MKKRYVMLRKPAETRRGAGLRESVAAGPAVEAHDLDAREAGELAREKDVEVLIRAMPMKLIAPRSEGPAPASPGGLTWGIRAVGADKSNFDGEGIVVAVLDTGIDPAHPAFNGVTLERRNFTEAGDDDDHGHGTHCAGTIFGREVAGTRIGVAPGVKKALIGKVLGKGGGGSDRLAQAIEWAADSGAHVISMSLGIDFPGYVAQLVKEEGMEPELATSMALEDYRANVLLFERQVAFIVARNAFRPTPTLLVAAAGNESQRDKNPDFEIAVSPPAVAEGFVSVAALGQGAGVLTVAGFSNVGARVSGPGVDVVSARRGGGVVAMSGTSMATPHVAGVAALWAQKLKAAGQLRGSLLAEKLVASATLTGLKAGVPPRQVGAGIVQAPPN